ncbi:MAG TPA: DUF4159 domain-containing protein [Elusimicrobiota bacterium]|nr:DUF4159 domain-containing protein [Elusimicrobiota bacterium]
MIFGAPALLWVLPLSAVPLAFHLIFRRRAKRLPFSNTLLLRRAYSRTKPLSRLRQWILVLLRCLVLLLLILACAKPILESSGGAGAGSRGTDVLFLLDRSYSMRCRQGGKTRFEQAQVLAQNILARLSGSDRAAVEFFAAKPEFPGGRPAWMSPAKAAALIAAAKPGYGTTDDAAALSAAQDFLDKDSGGRRRATLILSDNTRSGFKGAPPQLEPTILWLGLSWPAAQNLAIDSASPEPGLAGAGPSLRIFASGFKTENRDAVEVYLDSQRLPDAALRGGGAIRQAREILPAAPANESAAWWGKLALRPDALEADDEYFYSFRRPARPRVLCLYGTGDFFAVPEPGYFLRPLLGGPQGSLLPFDADFLGLDRISEAGLSRYAAVVLADARGLSAQEAARLKDYVAGGGGLLVVSGAAADPEPLARLLPWLSSGVGPAVPAEQGGIKPGPGSPKGAWDGFDLGQVSLGSYSLLQPKPDARIVLQSASGYPLLVAGSFGKGRTEVWAGSLNAARSNLVIRPVFAAWAQTALGEVAPPAPSEENLSLVVGQPIARRWSETEAAPASVRVLSPDGRSATVWLKNRAFDFTDTDTPGLYTVSDKTAGQSWVYAVNLDRSGGESDLSQLPSPPWKAVPARENASYFTLLLHGRSARDWILIATVLLMAAEMLMALGPRVLTAALLLFVLARPAPAQQGDRFVWTQIKLGGTWDPYPEVPPQILAYVSRLTSILVEPERRVIGLDDPALFSSPLIVLAGGDAPPPLTEPERKNLRDYFDGGGLLWLEDVSGARTSSFDDWARKTLPQVLPGASFQDVAPDDVIYKSFFLLRGPAGRVMTRGTLEKIVWGGRTAVIYSRNDILGAWALDPLGKPLYPCLPGGEIQREMAKRLTLNLVMFSLTGTYKDDAVHQPYILMKMREDGIP